MLTHDQKKKYEEQGYLIIKNYYTLDEIIDMDTHSSLREQYWQDDAKEALTHTTIAEGTSVWLQAHDSAMEVYNDPSNDLLLERLNGIGNLDPFFLQISLDYRILSIVSILLNTLNAYHLANQLNYKRPGSNFDISPSLN